jgi:SAM-dependent methyltransferase
MGISTAVGRIVLRLSPRRLRAAVFAGAKRYCPVCGTRLRGFLNYRGRRNALCPVCLSLERHRLTWLFLTERTDLTNGRAKRLLHMAPERGLESRLRAVDGVDYLSADLVDPAAMVRFDVTSIPFPDQSFDVILCSHVLEHVPDDRLAMRELARIMRPSGWAVIEVPPVRVAKTFEDPSITDPKERRRLFGQRDHVRVIGDDYPARLEENRWSILRFRPTDIAGDRMVTWGLKAEEEIFLGRSGRRARRPTVRSVQGP